MGKKKYQTATKHLDEKMLFEYQGSVNKKRLLEILPQIEQIAEDYSLKNGLKRRVINVAIESSQNIQIHACPVKSDWKSFFSISEKNETFIIRMGNLILTDEEAFLSDKLRKLNSLDEEEIKYLYNVVMKQTFQKFSEKGGAGLGLIDMKKKSGNPLEYSFTPVSDELTYFELVISIPLK